MPSGEAVVFPSVVVPLVTRNAQAVQLIEETFGGNRLVGIFAERTWSDHPDPDQLFAVGTVAAILRMARLPDGGVQALLQGLSRIQLQEFTQREGERELERLNRMSPASAEYIVSRTFLEWLASLPLAHSDPGGPGSHPGCPQPG